MDDVHLEGRWHVESPLDAQGREIVPQDFLLGRALRWEAPLVLPLYRRGRALDFSQTGLNFAVVNGRFATLCGRLGIQHQIQLIPARVEEHPEPYFVLNTLRLIRCVDEARCEERSFQGASRGCGSGLDRPRPGLLQSFRRHGDGDGARLSLGVEVRHLGRQPGLGDTALQIRGEPGAAVTV